MSEGNGWYTKTVTADGESRCGYCGKILDYRASYFEHWDKECKGYK